MRIIIVGCGKVGYTIARNLSAENDISVTIIDNDPEALEKASEYIDAMSIVGDGLNSAVLIEGDVKDADLMISVTNADEKNILACILAKHLGAKHTIARVRSPEYTLDINKLWEELGLDMTINPEQETAREISRLLRFPTAGDIDTFVGGRVELTSFKVSEAPDFFKGKSVAQIFYNKKMNVLLATIERGGSVLIPRGDVVFEQDDIIRVLGRPSDIMNFFSLIGKNTERIRSAVIAGGGKITYYLVSLLHRHSSSMGIKIIEIDKKKCESLSVAFPRCLVIKGDATDEGVLSSVVADQSEAIICLTDRDEENTIIALYSLQMGARKVIVKINHINQNMVKGLGLGSIVSANNITSNRIIRYIRGLTGIAGNNIRTVYKIFESGEDKVEVVEFAIHRKSKCLDTPIKKLRLKRDILIGCVVRGADIVIPTGESEIHMGDTVIIIAKDFAVLEIDDILSN